MERNFRYLSLIKPVLTFYFLSIWLLGKRSVIFKNYFFARKENSLNFPFEVLKLMINARQNGGKSCRDSSNFWGCVELFISQSVFGKPLRDITLEKPLSADGFLISSLFGMSRREWHRYGATGHHCSCTSRRKCKERLPRGEHFAHSERKTE